MLMFDSLIVSERRLSTRHFSAARTSPSDGVDGPYVPSLDPTKDDDTKGFHHDEGAKLERKCVLTLWPNEIRSCLFIL